MVAYMVQTEDLLGIRDQLSLQAGVNETARSAIAAGTSSMITALDLGTSTAQTTVGSLLTDLAALLSTTTAMATGADWLGADSETFRTASSDLIGVIERSRVSVEEAFTEHRTATGQLGLTMAATLAEFVAASTQSQEQTQQLAAAIGGEAQGYEAAFAGGFVQDPGGGVALTGSSGATPAGASTSATATTGAVVHGSAPAAGLDDLAVRGAQDLAAGAVRLGGDAYYDIEAEVGSQVGDAFRNDGDLVGGGVEKVGELVGARDIQEAGSAIGRGFDQAADTSQDAFLGLGSTVRNLDYDVATAVDGDHPPVEVRIYENRTPESYQHIVDAQHGTSYRGADPYEKQQDTELTIDRPGTTQRRRDSLRGIATKSTADRDEYPPATFFQGGTGASVKYISPGDNRSAGAQIGNQIRGVPDRVTPVRVVTIGKDES